MRTTLGNSLRVGMLSLGLVVGSAAVAGAQSGPGGGADAGSGRTTDTRADRGFDRGLLGLLGLAGLIPLFTRRNGRADAYGHTAGRGTAAH